jgi:hypothetical protein
MGLQDTFKTAAQTIVAAAGDIAVSTVYEAISSTTYNASAGTNAAVYSSVAGVSVIFDVFKLKQIDGDNIRAEDKMALIPAKSISTVTPSTDDRITQSGVVWRVLNVETDPAEALWTLHVRKS